MSAYTLAQAQAQLDAWLAASTAVASNQSYAIEVEGNRRQLTRADAGQIQKMIEFWETRVNQLSRKASGVARTRYITN